MEINKLKLVFFSPTGTTKKVSENFTKGIGIKAIEHIDITKSENRDKSLTVSNNELLIVAIPVYMARVPLIINSWLMGLKADATPAVPIVVYGNRTYGNALLELTDILKQAGCKIIGGGAFIGEHSFSSLETPASQGRPHKNDLAYAKEFGKRIMNKLNSSTRLDTIPDIDIPGSYPYGGVTDLWSVDFIDINKKCCNRGICAQVCPTGAINRKSNTIDIEKCISCCACIKSCPEKARTMKESRVKDAAIRVSTLYNSPKNPEYFL